MKDNIIQHNNDHQTIDAGDSEHQDIVCITCQEGRKSMNDRTARKYNEILNKGIDKSNDSLKNGGADARTIQFSTVIELLGLVLDRIDEVEQDLTKLT